MKAIEQYFNYLKEAGADVPSTADSFKKTLSDKTSAEQYYGYLKQNNFDAPDSFDSFAKTLGITKSPTVPVKKKDGSEPLSIDTPSVSGLNQEDPIPSVSALLKQRKKLKAEKSAPKPTSAPGFPLATVETAPTIDYDAEISKIDEQIKSKGYNPRELDIEFSEYDFDLDDNKFGEFYANYKKKPLSTLRDLSSRGWGQAVRGVISRNEDETKRMEDNANFNRLAEVGAKLPKQDLNTAINWGRNAISETIALTAPDGESRDVALNNLKNGFLPVLGQVALRDKNFTSQPNLPLQFGLLSADLFDKNYADDSRAILAQDLSGNPDASQARDRRRYELEQRGLSMMQSAIGEEYEQQSDMLNKWDEWQKNNLDKLGELGQKIAAANPEIKAAVDSANKEIAGINKSIERAGLDLKTQEQIVNEYKENYESGATSRAVYAAEVKKYNSMVEQYNSSISQAKSNIEQIKKTADEKSASSGVSPDDVKEYNKLYSEYESLSEPRNVADKFNSWASYLSKAQNNLIKNNPTVLADNITMQLQEEDGENVNPAERFMLGFGSLVPKAADAFEIIYDAIALSPDKKREKDYQRLGRSQSDQLLMFYQRQKDRVLQSPIITVVPDSIKKRIADINANNNLNEEEKEEAKKEALRQGFVSGQIYQATNPNAGKINITGKSILNSAVTVIPQILTAAGLSYITGGVGAGVAVSTFLNGYSSYYNDAISKSIANPNQYAFAHSLVDYATEMIGTADLKLIQNALKGNKGVGAKFFKDLTDGEFKSLLAGSKNAFKNTGKAFVKNALINAGETGEEIGAQVGGNIIDQELFGEKKPTTEGITETILTTSLGQMPLTLLGVPLSVNRNNIANKYALYNAATDVNGTMAFLKKELEAGNINSQEYTDRVKLVNDYAKAIKETPATYADGNPMRDDDKAKYAFNQFISNMKADKSPLPPQQKQNVDQVIANAENENDKILSNATNQSQVQEGRTEGNISQPQGAVQGQQEVGQGTGSQGQTQITTANVGDSNIGGQGQVAGQELSKTESLTPNQIEVTEDATGFADQMTSAQASLGSTGVSVTPYTQESYDEIASQGGKFLRAVGNKVLAVLKPNGEMVSLVKDATVKAKGAAQALITKMKDMGGLFMDNYDIYLTPIYQKAGYRVVARVPFDEQYAPEGWNNEDSPLKNKPDVVFMVRNDIAPDQEQSFATYEEAQNYTQGLVDQAVNSGAAKLPTQVTKIDKVLNETIPMATQALEQSGVKFQVVDPATDTEQARAARGNQGLFRSEDGTIIIDKSKLADEIEAGIVVWHEASHPVMNMIRNSDKPLYDAVVRGLKQAAKKNKGVAGALNWAQSQEQYDNEDTQNDEAVVETIGRINAGLIDINSLDTGLRQKLIDFVNSIAKYFGIDPILNDRDIAAFKKTVSEVADALKTGRDISEIVGKENVKEYKLTDIDGNPITDKYTQFRVSGWKNLLNGITFKYLRDSDRYNQLKNDGFITEDRTVSDFSDKPVVLHVPDHAFTGEMIKDDEVIVEGKGGVFYPLRFHDLGYFWASTKSAAAGMAAKLNAMRAQSPDGKIRLMLLSAPQDKLMSSTAASNSMLDVLMSKAFDRRAKIKKDQIVNAYINGISKLKDIARTRGKDGIKFDGTVDQFIKTLPKVNKSMTADQFKSTMRAWMAPNVSNFDQRKKLNERVLQSVAELVTDADAKNQVFEFFKGIAGAEMKTTGGRLSMANLMEGFSKLFSEPMLKGETKTGDAYAVIELDGDVEAVETGEHESYPFAIKSKDANKKPVVHILQDRKNWTEFTVDPLTGELVSPERESSVLPPSSGISNIVTIKSSPEQASVGNRGQLLAPNGKPSNLTPKQYEQVRTPEFKNWFGDWENDPVNASKVVDENGEPLVVYHNSPSKDVQDFKGYVTYFTDNKEYAGKVKGTASPNQYDAYLNVRKPYNSPSPLADVPIEVHNTDQFTNPRFIKSGSSNYDAVVGKDAGQDDGVTYAVFNPNQIKSATGNSGAFSTTDNRIQASVGNRDMAGMINWEKLKPGKGDPKISSRNPIVTKAAADLKAGKITNEEYRAVASQNSPIRPITKFFEPATKSEVRNALSTDKLDKIDTPIQDGSSVGIRLDIPAFKNNNTWVVSVHEGNTNAGKSISYTNVARITDVNFGLEPKAGLKIAAGESKSTIGRIFGKWQNLDGANMEDKGETAKEIIQDAVGNPDWVQVGFNPFRHSYFYDRSSDMGRPIVSADEVVQIGGLVYAKNPIYGNWTDESYRVKGLFDAAGAPVQFSVGNRSEEDLRAEGTGKERPRALASKYGNLNPETQAKIEDDATVYFQRTNKQTKEAVDKFLDGLNIMDAADYVLSNPKIPEVSQVWMAAEVAKRLNAEIDAAKDQDLIDDLTRKQADIFNEFAKRATSLGQAVQAFIAFKDNANAVEFFLPKVLRQLKKAGVENVTEEQRADILTMLKDVNTAAEGLPKYKAIIKLSHYLAGIAPIKILDVLQAIWYAKILSGVTTQSTNFFASIFNTVFELPAVALRISIMNGTPLGLAAGAKGFASGVAKGAVTAADIIKSGVRSKEVDKYFAESPLEYFTWSKWLGNKGKVLDYIPPLNFGAWKYVGRILSATDAFFATANQEAIANMLAYAEAAGTPAGNNFKKANAILGNNKMSVLRARAQAKAEGFEPGTIQYKRRELEIIAQKRTSTQEADEIGKRITMNYDPEGFTKPLFDAVVALQRTIPPIKMVIPFARIVANLTENGLNYSPLGFAKAATGIKNPFQGLKSERLSTEQRVDLFTKFAIGISTLAVLAANVGEDDDDWFEITAGGSPDVQKKYELQKGGWRPYTITLKDGTKISYKDWPIAGILAGVGHLRDAKKYSFDDSTQMGLYGYGFFLNMYDKSLLSGLQDFFGIFNVSAGRGKYAPDTKASERAMKYAAQQVKSVAISNLSQQTGKLYSELVTGDPQRDAKTFMQVIYRDIPSLNDGIRPIIDVFGDEVKYTTTERLLPIMASPEKEEIIEWLNKNKLFVGVPMKKNIKLLDGTERPMTDAEYYEYRKNAGKGVKKFINEFISEIKDKEIGEEAFEKVVSAARQEAYAEILMKANNL